MMKPILTLASVSFFALTSAAVADEVSSDLTSAEGLFSKYVLREAAEPIRDDPRWARLESVVVYVPSFVLQRTPEFEQQLQSTAPDAEFTFVTSRAEFKAAAPGADAAILGDCGALDESMSSLRWVQRTAVGVERCLARPLDWQDSVLLTNIAGMSGPFIAEHTIAMIMMLAHDMTWYYRNQLDSGWRRSSDDRRPVTPVADRTLLVVGLGGIGTKVAEKAAGLGMRVLAVRNSSRSGPDFVDYVGLSDELHELASKADFVVNTVPLTPSTTGMYDAGFFDAMKSNAFFVSVGRGGSTVTEDLVAALKSGSIAGAGLDVTDPEPLPTSHELWSMPNVIITPHTSAITSSGSPDYLVFFRDNLRRYVTGEPMLNVVDPEKGY